MKPKVVIVEVSGGVAEVTHEPPGVIARIVDWDNLKEEDIHCPACSSDDVAPMEDSPDDDFYCRKCDALFVWPPLPADDLALGETLDPPERDY